MNPPSRSNSRFSIVSLSASLSLLLALLITPTPIYVAAVTCPSAFSSPCPTASDPIPRLRSWLKDHFFGQDYALQLVESLINTNLYETRTTPLVLHFSGPTGVGKTSLAHAISEAFFYKKSGDPPQLCGVLKLEMGRIMNEVDDKNRMQILESHLLRPIYHQLKTCPRSIIILDDIHFVDVDILNGLKPIFDWPPQVSLSTPLHPVTTPDTPSFPPEPVSSANAIFILTSDLEGSQHELLVDTLTREEAVNIVRDLTSARWGPANRMLHLVTLVPFLRLTEEHHFKVLQHSFRLFETIIRDQLDREMKARKLSHVIEWVGTVWVQKGTEATILAGQREQTHLYGARAIESYVKQNAYFHINSIVQTFLTARPPEPSSTPSSSPSQPALPPTSPLLSTVIRPATRVMGMRIPLSRDHVVILNDVIVSVDQHHELQIELSNTKTTTSGQGNPRLTPHARGDQRDEL